MKPIILVIIWFACMAYAIHDAYTVPCTTDTECQELNGGNGDPE